MKAIERIAGLQLADVAAQMKSNGIEIEFADGIAEYLAAKSYDPGFGARPLRRIINSTIRDPLADALIDGRFETDRRASFVLESDSPVLKMPNKRA